VLPFGYGLHYTTFDVRASMESPINDIAALVRQCGTIRPEKQVIANIQVSIKNKGNTTSDYVALAFLSGEFGPTPWPLKQLVGFKRAHDILPGMTASVNIPLQLSELTRWDKQGQRILYPGVYNIAIDTVDTKTNVTFTLTGPPKVVEQWPQRAAQG
jgi:beta-D-xylosidase 4